MGKRKKKELRKRQKEFETLHPDQSPASLRVNDRLGYRFSGASGSPTARVASQGASTLSFAFSIV